MAINEIQGSLVITQLSLDGLANWKTFVCEQGSKFSGSTNVTVEKTKCGSIKAVDDPDWKMSGDGVANRLPSSTEVSFNEILGYMQSTRKVHVRKMSQADSANSLAEGDAYYRQGVGYFTSVDEDSSNAAVVKFTYNFEVQGELITELPSANFDTELTFISTTTDGPESGVTATAGATNANLKFEFEAQADTEELPLSMSIKVDSVEKLTVDYDGEYEGEGFRFTNTDSVVYTGVFTEGTVEF